MKGSILSEFFASRQWLVITNWSSVSTV